MSIIKASGVNLSYPNGNHALKDISFEIGSGEIAYIIGPSGSGKTSLLKLLLGIEKVTTGTLALFGENRPNGKVQEMRRQIGPVFQEFRLLEGRTAYENVMTGMRFMKLNTREMAVAASEALEKVGLSHKSDSLVQHLSWGESQRVAIARAVARKPRLIVADEPTGNLDYDNALNILNLLSSFSKDGTTVVITTHATHLLEDVKKHHLMKMTQGEMTWEKFI